MDIRNSVREMYGRVAESDGEQTCCAPSCCGGTANPSLRVGYTAEQLASIPEKADLGLGCGNPTTIANLEPGQVVLDLGSGGGIDAFLAARAVGPRGHVIGVDMTPQMIDRARENASSAEVDNVEFRLGEIEHLPVADATVDVIISNCVVNLSADKPAVFGEAFRALKPGGRLAISDIVATDEVPPEIANDLEALAACVGGAEHVDRLRAMLADVGFVDVRVRVDRESAKIADEWVPGAANYVASATIEATKPS